MAQSPLLKAGIGKDMSVGASASSTPDRNEPSPGGGRRDIAGLSDHREHHLAVEFDRVGGEHGIVAHDRAHVVLAGDVRRRDDRDDARLLLHLGKIEAADGPARDRRTADGDVQGARRLGNVVDVFGVPRRGGRRDRARWER
jgi:hypothetical protein